MLFRKPIIDPSVNTTVVDYPSMYDYQSKISSIRPPEDSRQSSDEWDHHHKKLMAILSTFGRVESCADAHRGFYHSLDCYNDYDDGVAMMNRRVLKDGLFTAIQNQLKTYLDSCMFTLSGDTPLKGSFNEKQSIDGLNILITQTEVMIQWVDCGREECIERILAAGINYPKVKE